MFQRFMIVCWVLFAITTVVSLLGYAGHKFYEKKTGELYEMGYNPFSKYDGSPFLDLYPDNELLLIAQNRKQEDRSGPRDDSLVDDQKTEGENGRTYSDIPAGFKVVEPDSTDWRDAPIVDEAAVREQKRRYAAMAELDHRYDRRKGKWQTIGFIGVALAAILFMWNIIWHLGHWIWMGRKAE